MSFSAEDALEASFRFFDFFLFLVLLLCLSGLEEEEVGVGTVEDDEDFFFFCLTFFFFALLSLELEVWELESETIVFFRRFSYFFYLSLVNYFLSAPKKGFLSLLAFFLDFASPKPKLSFKASVMLTFMAICA